MSLAPFKNKLYGHVAWRTTSNATINLADANYSNAENVQALAITQLMFAGPWTVKRGSNVLLDFTGTTVGQGAFDFAGQGLELSEFATGTIVLTSGASNGWIIIEANKVTTANGTPF